MEDMYTERKQETRNSHTVSTVNVTPAHRDRKRKFLKQKPRARHMLSERSMRRQGEWELTCGRNLKGKKVRLC